MKQRLLLLQCRSLHEIALQFSESDFSAKTKTEAVRSPLPATLCFLKSKLSVKHDIEEAPDVGAELEQLCASWDRSLHDLNLVGRSSVVWLKEFSPEVEWSASGFSHFPPFSGTIGIFQKLYSSEFIALTDDNGVIKVAYSLSGTVDLVCVSERLPNMFFGNLGLVDESKPHDQRLVNGLSVLIGALGCRLSFKRFRRSYVCLRNYLTSVWSMVLSLIYIWKVASRLSSPTTLN